MFCRKNTDWYNRYGLLIIQQTPGKAAIWEKNVDIIAFTGAGISAASGIPTFEELGEEFRRSLSRSVFNANPEGFYKNVLKLKAACDAAQPNPAHIALARHSIPVITMNIDGLHRRAGTTDLIEIHGSLETVHCKRCARQYPFAQTEQGCRCPNCGGLLLHDVVLYEDQIPRLVEALDRVSDLGPDAAHPRTLLVIGTSFYTSTSSYVVDQARACGWKIVVINQNAETEVPAFLNQNR
jgi:NAD-dependent deacetylase